MCIRDRVWIDKVGNCIGKIKGTDDKPLKAMIFGHTDQLGFIVRKVEEDGYIQVDRLGGIPDKVLPGTELIIRSEDELDVYKRQLLKEYNGTLFLYIKK